MVPAFPFLKEKRRGRSSGIRRARVPADVVVPGAGVRPRQYPDGSDRILFSAGHSAKENQSVGYDSRAK